MTQYSGKIIRKNAVVPTQQSASGVWTVTDAAAATRNNAWPVAGVPDPISRSVRLRSSASASLTRTPATATNRKTWTWSGWVKRGALSTSAGLFGAYSSGAAYAGLYFDSSNALGYQDRSSGVNNALLATTQVFRDPSAWYHIVMAMDSTQATSSNRIKLYVNGSQITAFSTATYPSLNFDGFVDNNITHELGSLTGTNFFDGYMTEINFVDGQQLTPSSFGTTDAFTGAWVPMAYTGTYGANGFYLNFKDNTSTTTLGYDYSGNSNNWTANNISLTAGVTYDSMLDVPTPWIGYNTDGGVSVTRGNYAVLNPLAVSGPTYSEANLRVGIGTGATTVYTVPSTIGVSSGKWYWETILNTQSSPNGTLPAGITNNAAGNQVYGYAADGKKWTNWSTNSAYGATFTTGDVIGAALDMDSGTLTFYKNGVSQGVAFTGLTGEYFAAIGVLRDAGAGSNSTINFGQRPFAQTVPTGYKALCTTNLPESTIKLGASYMAASLYTGNATARSIVNSGNNTTSTTFQPDFVWTKDRTVVADHRLYDSVRGATKRLFSSATLQESVELQSLTAFNSDGFSIGTANDSNQNSSAYVAWQWKANGAAVSNTNGTITSSVSAGTTQGFSVVTYTGSGVNATVGHGLGVAPKMVIVKNRSAVSDWLVWQTVLAGTEYLLLDTTAAKATAANVWNSTVPSSTVISVGINGGTNGSANNYVAYCFAEVAGYSKFGSYTGNGSTDGPFIYCGFRPRFIMVKCSSTAGTNWTILDTSRNTANATTATLYPNLSDTEATSATGWLLLSNGFKSISTGLDWNSSGATYIYMAVAENPFKYSNAR